MLFCYQISFVRKASAFICLSRRFGVAAGVWMSCGSCGMKQRMQFSAPLIPALLIRRYKRFLADVRLEDGREVTVHCANPGSMLGLATPGMRVWVEPNDDPKRKLRYGWRLVELPDGHFVGVDTGLPNRLVKAALHAGVIPGLPVYDTVRPEVKYGQNSRVDFVLGTSGQPDNYLEVKSVTLCRQPGLAEFPDSVTKRGAKHLADLAFMVAQGQHATLLYLVQRSDCSAVAVASDIDPGYAAAFAEARANGVVVLCIDCDVSPKEITLGRTIMQH